MASLANANLPSSDEEDDDYDPSLDPTGEKEPGQQGKAAGQKRGRGAVVGDAGADNDEADDTEPARPKSAPPPAADDDILTPAQAAKKARISAMFDQLHESCTQSANKLSKSSISLASLCSNTNPKKKRNTDLLWMRNLGITPSSGKIKQRLSDAAAAASLQSPITPATAAAAAAAADAQEQQAPASAPPATGVAAAADTATGTSAGAAATNGEFSQQQEQNTTATAIGGLRAAAAAALAAAKEGASGGVSKSYNKVTLTETRRFAGKDIEVTVEVDKDSKAAKKAAERSAAAASGLDAFLTQIEGKKKVSVLDKSKMDWQDFKSTDVEVQEELEAHRRSDKQYLDKQDFLKRAELREYELERDKRLASDVRLRGRL